MPTIEEVVYDGDLTVPERTERVIELLAAEDDRGLALALDVLLSTDDERVADYVAAHLGTLPDAQDVKGRAAERLASVGPLLGSASWLVPWMPKVLARQLVADYVAEPSPRSLLFAVIFEIATYWPEHLRPFAQRLDHPSLQHGMLSGAPDGVVAALVARWEQEGDAALLEEDEDLLDEIARVRTDRAAGTLMALRDEVEDRERWETAIAMAGRLPDGEHSSYGPSFMGFVVEPEKGPHAMGGAFPGDVPLCPVCETPADRVLTLAAGSLPFGLSRDPSFFWYACSCNALDFTAVQLRDDGQRVFYGPAGGPSLGGRVIPGERAMLLERHPNQAGISIDATGGFGRHQVGGLPRWNQPSPHPRCPGCSAPMKFLASVDSGPTPFGHLRFAGTLYGFWCDPCAVSIVRRQG